jgi:SNF2 family DNA or RNA helicase
MKSLPKDADERTVSYDMNKLNEASRSFGHGNCVAEDGKWRVKGMKSLLLSHQVIGTHWMLKREFSSEGPWGGILADEMGLGKTIETLTCIVSNLPEADDLGTYCKTTLIVAPATAIKQWESEIKKHTLYSHIGGVLHYKKSKDLPPEALTSMGIM